MIDLFLRIYQHLLPRSQAWKIVIEKTLRDFFTGLTVFPAIIKLYYDKIWLDIFPQSTRQLDEWEAEFGLVIKLEDEQERRNRLDAEWKALGGQSPGYIQGVLRDAGFDVYVHEWWYYANDYAPEIIFGNLNAVFGAPNAIFGNSSAITRQTRDPRNWIDSDHVLVNNILFTKKEYIPSVVFGNNTAVFGASNAIFGAFSGIVVEKKKYNIPDDPDSWPFFWYIGGVDFGTFANIPIERQAEFETLVLKIKPRQTWVGLFINYV